MSATHREGLCQVCERGYPIWFAPNPLWNAAIRATGTDEWAFLCPTCFATIAHDRGVWTDAWCLTSDITGHEDAAALAYALREVVIQGEAALTTYRNRARRRDRPAGRSRRTNCDGPKCRAEIVWTVTTQGRRQPVDAEPNPLGNLVLDDHDPPNSHVEGLMDEPGPRYMPHHATCPNVDQWRRST